MGNIKIVVDSGCDMPRTEAAEKGICVLPLGISFDEDQYFDGINITHELFYEKLIESDVLPKTSQVTPFEYEKAFKKILAEDADAKIICITISGKLSGCYQSANIARENLDAEDIIALVDSETVCIGEMQIVNLAYDLINKGMSFENIVTTLEKKKKDLRIIALLDTLEYLKKGGRISSAVAFAGNILSIKPVVTTVEGEVVLLGKARGSKAGNNLLNELVSQSGGIDKDYPVVLAYSGLSDALLKKYAADSAALYAHIEGELPCYTIGSAIGTHIGPGAICTAFFAKQ